MLLLNYGICLTMTAEGRRVRLAEWITLCSKGKIQRAGTVFSDYCIRHGYFDFLTTTSKIRSTGSLESDHALRVRGIGFDQKQDMRAQIW
jgi:hypothetical protein